MVELRTAQKLSNTPPKLIVPVTHSPPSSVSLSNEKDEFSLKEDLKRVKIFRYCVSGGSPEEGRKTDQTSLDYHQFDIDFPNDSAEEESEGNMESSNLIHLFNYETLTCANLSRQSSLSNTLIYDKDEQWTYNGNVENSTELFPDHLNAHNSNRKILSWRKLSRKKSTKNKGKPLLNKIGEEGGDDIDYCCRQLSCFEGSNSEQNIYMFGEDNFSVGSWEAKEVTSRDGHLELRTKIFFASIDQRNERAAGESACTALVVDIADWLQSNRNLMPTKSESPFSVISGVFPGILSVIFCFYGLSFSSFSVLSWWDLSASDKLSFLFTSFSGFRSASLSTFYLLSICFSAIFLETSGSALTLLSSARPTSGLCSRNLSSNGEEEEEEEASFLRF